jgi:hypothetical protein
MSQHDSQECSDRLENGIEALVDVYLLASCDFLVGDGTSSFTRLAGLLCQAPEGHVVDVRPTPKRLTLLRHEIWRRHAASDSVVSTIVRMAVRGRHPLASFRSQPRSERPALTGTRRSSGR